jgi:hypothetical protein
MRWSSAPLTAYFAIIIIAVDALYISAIAVFYSHFWNHPAAAQHPGATGCGMAAP